jgi:regulator of sigma E protease
MVRAARERRAFGRFVYVYVRVYVYVGGVNVLRFVALIGALVFVHELGHFALAKAFGVRVLKFSLGFGPRLVGFTFRGTEYCIGLVPFGGFVKMLGEDPGDRVKPEDLEHAFHTQSLWRRFLIVLAGPAMSLIFPALIYFVVFLGQTEMAPPVIGTVVAGHPADGKLLPGDRVISIDDDPVGSFQEVRERIAESPGRPLRFRVRRGDAEVDATVTPVSVRIERPLGVVEYVGRAGISAGFPMSVIAVRPGVSPASRAGLHTFDLVTSYAGRPIARAVELERTLNSSRGATVPVSFLRPRAVNGALGGLCDLEVLDPGLAMITPDPGEGDVATRTGIESPDLYIADVPVRSAEYEMGLRRGDKILLLDGVPPASYEAFRESMLAGGSRQHEVSFRHEGREVAGAFALRPSVWTDEFGQRYTGLVFRTDHWLPTVSEATVPNPAPTTYAIRHAWRETGEVLQFLSLTIVRLLQGRLPISTVGGPMMIYDATRSTATDGVWGFLWLMALVSVNLGLLNLLPIPTLDGGHLLFFVIEGATRRAVPLRVRKIASVVGLAFLVMIMGVALKNDLQRKFGRQPTLPLSNQGP